MGLLPDLFSPPKQQEVGSRDKKKKKNYIEEIEDVKKIYNRLQQIKKYVGYLTNPGVIVALIIFGIIILVIVPKGSGPMTAGADPAPSPASGNPAFPPIPGLTLTLSGPSRAGNDENLTYRVSIAHNESVGNIPIENITVYLDLPPNAFLALATGQSQSTSTQVTWPLSEQSNQAGFTFTLVPLQPDSYVEVKVYGRAAGASGGGGLGGLLPTTTFSAKVDNEQQAIAATIKGLPELVAAYQLAEAATGVPWQALAGIHFKEGSLNGNNSLVSGRPIGTNEPDIVRGGGCSATYVVGEPVALPDGGCGFRTFADSAIYAANHFKGKNGGLVPATFEEMAKSLSYYNGGGNSNCGKTPYTGCPAAFTGDDDAYVMTFFDQKHEEMYIVYCADFTLCDPPRLDVRPGVAAVIMALSRFY